MFKEIIEYFKEDKKTFRSILVFIVMSGLIILTIPFLIQTLIQQYSLLVFQQSTTFVIILFAVFLISITVMRLMQMNLSEFLQRRLFLKAIDQAQNYYKEQKAIGLDVSKMEWNYIFEAVSLQKTAVPLFIEGITFAFQSIVVLLLISIYHPFFVVYSLILGAAFYWVTIPLGKKALELSNKESKLKHSLIASMQEDPLNQDLEKDIFRYFSMREKRYSLYFRQSTGLFIIKIFAAIVLIFVGGVLVLNNQMTIGQLIASELIVTNLLISLFKFSYVLDYYYDTAVSVKKLNIYNKKSTT